jgi:hypothetical protein
VQPALGGAAGHPKLCVVLLGCWVRNCAEKVGVVGPASFHSSYALVNWMK